MPTSAAPAPLLAWREVDLGAVRHNVRQLAATCPTAEVMVVVKADGYSNGAPEVARAALDAGATYLGVATIDEALALRRAGVAAPVLAWLAGPGSPYRAAIAHGIELAAYSCDQLSEIAEAARDEGTAAVVHLKADTGMWRGGAADEWPQLVARAREHETRDLVCVVGMWSHLACADVVDHPATTEQGDRFRHAVQVAEEAGLRPRLRHLANSAATLTRPDLHFDMVRCGLATYGVNPLTGRESPVPLRPVVSVRARVTHVKRAPAGVGVSYGHTYRTPGPTTLALVPLGYADGIPVIPTPASPAGHRGEPVPLAGRVCMDQLVLDVGDRPVQPGDVVTVVGSQDDGAWRVEDWAAFSGRSPYEIITGLGRPRVPAIYVNGQWPGSGPAAPTAVRNAQN